jgi:hypothetical protein
LHLISILNKGARLTTHDTGKKNRNPLNLPYLREKIRSDYDFVCRSFSEGRGHIEALRDTEEEGMRCEM